MPKSNYLSGQAAIESMFPVPSVVDQFINRSWYKLSAQERRQAIQYALENTYYEQYLLDKQTAWKLFDVKQVENAGEADVSVGKGADRKHYKIGNNPSNRSISQTTLSEYAKDMQNAFWRADGQPIAFYYDAEEQRHCIATGQHRGGALIEAMLNDAKGDMKVPVTVIFNVPYPFSDGYDTNRKFSKTDLVYKHRDDVFQPLPIYTTDPNGEKIDTGETAVCISLSGEAMPDRMGALIKAYAASVRSVLARMQGKQGIRSGGKTDGDALVKGGEYGNLPDIVASTAQWVLMHQMGTTNKDKFEPYTTSMVTTLLVLVANRTNTNSKELVDPRENDDCVRVLEQLCEQEFGIFGPALSVACIPKGKGTVSGDRKFDILANAVLTYLTTGDPQRLTLGEAAKRWDMKTEKIVEGIRVKVDNDKFNSYPYFGGIDKGYVKPSRGKKTEDTDDSETESVASE